MHSKEHGFTIIELIMVIVIIGILAGLAIPRFESFYAIKLDGATKKAVSDIRYIQHLALAGHTNARIVFNAVGNSYVGQEEVPEDSGNWQNAKDPFTRGDLNVQFNSDAQYRGIDIQNPSFGGSATLRFNWLGEPVSGGSVDFVYKGRSRRILVADRVGRVSLQ